jgi:hypothetical protein
MFGYLVALKPIGTTARGDTHERAGRSAVATLEQPASNAANRQSRAIRAICRRTVAARVDVSLRPACQPRPMTRIELTPTRNADGTVVMRAVVLGPLQRFLRLLKRQKT